MPIIKKGRCVKTQFERKILCAGTLQDLIRIQRREIKGTNPGQSTQAGFTFTDVARMAGCLEQYLSRNSRRFDGVSTEDSAGPAFTHEAYITFDQEVYELDYNTLYVRYEGKRDRLFKLKGIVNYGEQDEWLQLHLQETGFADREAAQG